MQTNTTNTEPERLNLVPDKRVREEFQICAMTLYRWDRDPDLGFPPPVLIRKRKFRARSEIEAFKQRMLALALADRGRQKAAA